MSAMFAMVNMFTLGWALMLVGWIVAVSCLWSGGGRVGRARLRAAPSSTRPFPVRSMVLAMNPQIAADMEEYIKMADDFGLKDNDKVRLVFTMAQKDFEKEKELAQKDFEKELAQKDFEKEKELAQSDMQHKLSGLESLRRRDLSAISKRFVGDRVLKLTHGILLVY